MAELDELWAEVADEGTPDRNGYGPGGKALNLPCPPSALVVWSNKSVYIQVKEDGSGIPIFGEFSLRAEQESGVAWISWQPHDDENQLLDASKYALSSRLCHIHSFRLVRPSMGTPQVLINLRSGGTHPPLFFHSGGVNEFKSCLAEYAALTKSEMDSATLLVNDETDMLQRSLSELDIAQASSPAAPTSMSRAATKPNSPLLANSGNGTAGGVGGADGGRGMWRGPMEGEWKWKALQGGVSVMKGLRPLFARGREAIKDAAQTAAELLAEGVEGMDMEGPGAEGAERGEGRSHNEAAAADAGREGVQRDDEAKEGGESGKRESSEARHPRISLEGLKFGDDECVFVEHEPAPWEQSTPLDSDEWRALFDKEGRLQNFDTVKRRAYYGGFAPAVRREGWKYLLGCYPPGSTRKEREALLAAKGREYENYRRQWESITLEQEARFSKFRERRHRIEKDVIRTDRSNPMFADDEGEGLRRLNNILLTYSFYNFDLSYCQGMNELAAPLLLVMEDEVEAFWCFQKLMDITEPNFHKDSNGMHTQLQLLRHLCQGLEPELFAYLESRECSNLYFCFRWLLILYKREFALAEVVRLWEALWSRVRGENLHLFFAVAIMRQHKQHIMAQDMGFDDVLKYVNDLAGKLKLMDTLRDADMLVQRHCHLTS